MHTKTFIALTLGLVVLGGVFFLSSGTSGQVQAVSERTNREIATTCDPEMGQVFHIHPTLEIRVNGETVEVPANIGVTAICMTAIHTHTPDGVIHVESPEKRDFDLSDFFAVWGQSFNKEEILTHKADATHRVRITVDGIEVDTYEKTILKDKEKIVISYEAI